MGIFAYINPDCKIPTNNLVLSPLRAGWVLDSALNWSAWIDYSEHGRNDHSPVFNGRSDNWSPIPIDFQNICLGGVIHISVKATVRDIVTGAKDTINWDGHSSILGQNPDKQIVKTFLNDIKLQVIAYKESRFMQFSADGQPKFGPPNGFGIMQLDNSPTPTQEQIWSWKDNANDGRKKYNDGAQVIRNHYNNLIHAYPKLPVLPEPDLQKAIYQYFNSGNNGFYWSPNLTNTDWVKNSNSVFTIYGDNASLIECQVSKGNLPDEW